MLKNCKKNFLNQNEFNEKLLYKTCIQSRNYKFSPDDLKINYDVLYYLCKNNYLMLVDLFLKAKKLDLNECYSKHISNHFFFFIEMKKQLFMQQLKKEILILYDFC